MLWTPPTVAREMEDGARQDEADVRLAAALSRHLEWWTSELKKVDDRLEMVWFDENVQIQGVVPCRYHVLRRNDPPAPVSVIPVTGPEGEFIEPNSALFDKLRASDMWSAEVQRDRRKAQEEITRAKERQSAREREERQEEILERWLAASQVRISFNQDSPWTQNQSAAARRDAGQRKVA